jgi:hypothetical protein
MARFEETIGWYNRQTVREYRVTYKMNRCQASLTGELIYADVKDLDDLHAGKGKSLIALDIASGGVSSYKYRRIEGLGLMSDGWVEASFVHSYETEKDYS